MNPKISTKGKFMNNHTTIENKSQELLKKTRYFNYCSNGKLKLLNTIFMCFNRHRRVFPSQAWLAKKSGLTRQTVNEYIKEFVFMGIISKHFRFLDTCLYFLPDLFRDKYVRNKLAVIFTAFQFFSAQLLASNPTVYSSSGSDVSKNPTLVNLCYVDSYIYNPLLNCRTYSNSETESKVRDMRVMQAHARPPQTEIVNRELRTKQKSEREIMDAQQRRVLIEQLRRGEAVSPVFKEIEDIQELALSTWGKIKLMMFVPEAVVQARKEFKQKRGKPDSFGLFYNLCREYCKSRQIPTHYWYVKQVQELLKISDDADVVDAREQKKPLNEGKPGAEFNADSLVVADKMLAERKYKALKEAWRRGIDYRKYTLEEVRRILNKGEYPPHYVPATGEIPEPILQWPREVMEKIPNSSTLLGVPVRKPEEAPPTPPMDFEEYGESIWEEI